MVSPSSGGRGRRSRPPPRRPPKTSTVGPTICLVLGLILMLGSGAAIGVPSLRDRLPGGSGGDSAEPSTTASGPAPPESAAELIAYVMAGTQVDATPYILPGNSEPVYGFSTPDRTVECQLDPYIQFYLCSFAEPAWPAAERPADCAESQGWSPESIVVSQGVGVRRGFCYDSAQGSPLQQTSAVLDHGQRISAVGFSCRSESWYVACVDEETGDGFVVGHDFYKLVGTVAP